MRLYFKSVIAKKAGNDWPMGFYGKSCIDNQDYAISTHYLKSDEVPDEMQDAKTSSEFIAGLLNAYYKQINVVGMNPDEIKRMGIYVESEDVPVKSENQTETPF